YPESMEDWGAAKRRLGFEEIMGIQLRVMQAKILREKIRQNPYPIPLTPEVVKEDLKRFPFELTLGQKKALLDILEDFEKDRPMNRLLQGDVGSGKTAVAFLASLQMIRGGFQAAILAPTEILSKQHFANALKFFPQKYKIELLTGSTTAKNKERIKSRLLSGEIDVIIGTHAILTEDTIFKHLALAVIDEQHRFGVKQRAALSEGHTHILNMTATPIPRSMALTIYGDQDLSIIREKPAGRKDIITRVVADPKTITLCQRFIEDQIGKGFQIFWVCPLVEYSEKMDAKNVMEHFEVIKKLFPKARVNYLHGKMKPKDKDAVMGAFKEKQHDILVSTSVIEVGVDIPNATVMCIENSERFGLSQLHQFRGRIGRNDRQSYCFLMVGDKEDKHKERLRAMEKSNDGFYLSEVDLKLRGAGEVYGTRQSGLPDLKCADLNDVDTMQKARTWAEKVLKQDIGLERYPGLRSLIAEKEVFYS
ncbi:MAG TPA: ATP-dependent DNA helicase RecG, partial [Candidatus Gracilibacteria bacterium]